MEAINNLINRPPANSIQAVNNDQTKRPNNNFARASNGQFAKKNTVSFKEPLEDNVLEEDVEVERTRVLQPKIAKLPKTTSIIKRPKKQEFENYNLVGLGFPEDLREKAKREGKEHRSNLKYSIPVYIQLKDNPSKTYTKNVQFGNVKDKDFVETNDIMDRLKYVNKKPIKNFLDGRFYKVHILNSTHNDIIDATKELKNVLNI